MVKLVHFHSICNERLNICLSGWKIPLMQNLTIDDEISTNLGLLLDFKLLKASSDFLFWRVYSCNTVSETSINCLKSLEEVGIEDASLGPILVKEFVESISYFILIKSFNSIYNHSFRNITFKSFNFTNNVFYRVPRFLLE